VNALEFVAVAPALAGLPGALGLLTVTAGALLPARRVPGEGAREHNPESALDPAVAGAPGPLWVLVPAHDEAAGIAACVASLREAAEPPNGLEIVVVADNCSDDTAKRARAAGARVLERRDTQRRGKGYALALGFERALAEGAAGVLVVDADSRVAPDLFTRTAEALAAGCDGTQCRYEPDDPGDAPIRRLRRLAFIAFNAVRPRGRERLGLSCGLFGNGFALCARVLAEQPYGAHSIVEDLEYHLDLVRRGRRVRYLGDTWVRAPLPESAAGARTQHTRWEGGRLGLARERLLGLTWEGLTRRPRLLEPAADLALLPLGLHVALFLPALVVGGPWGRPLALAFGVVLALHLGLALVLAGCDRRDLLALASAPWYIAGKWRVLPAVLSGARRRAPWKRTERDNGPTA
jgi:hypothetical protein